jgi:hypothetical protein
VKSGFLMIVPIYAKVSINKKIMGKPKFTIQLIIPIYAKVSNNLFLNKGKQGGVTLFQRIINKGSP